MTDQLPGSDLANGIATLHANATAARFETAGQAHDILRAG